MGTHDRVSTSEALVHPPGGGCIRHIFHTVAMPAKMTQEIMLITPQRFEGFSRYCDNMTGSRKFDGWLIHRNKVLDQNARVTTLNP